MLTHFQTFRRHGAWTRIVRFDGFGEGYYYVLKEGHSWRWNWKGSVCTLAAIRTN